MRVTLLLALSLTAGLGLAACSSGSGTPAVPAAPASNAHVLPAADVYIVSNGSDLVYEYTSGGQEVTTFAPPPSVPWVSPTNIAYDSENDLLYVSGGYSNPISEFSTSGLYSANFADPAGDVAGIVYDAADDVLFIGTSWPNCASSASCGGASGPPEGLFKVSPSGEVEAGPTGPKAFGVTYDSRDKLIFAVNYVSGHASSFPYLAVYDTNLNFLTSFSFTGLTGLMLWNPVSNLLYVGEQDNAKIYAYKVRVRDNEITLHQRSLTADSFSSLENPVVMANDQAGNIYITDSGTQDVQVFGPAGRYLDSIGSGISGPWGIVVVPN